MTAEFSVRIDDGKTPDTKVAHIIGELDEVTIEQLKQSVDPLLDDPGIHQLIFDLTNLIFINSKGIGYFVSVHSHMAKDDRTLAIANDPGPVMDVISLVGLTNIIPYFATLEEALK